ncbi:MAG: tryptophan synthase subunit alpha [Phycisphaerales bacterium]|nr:MAG: tryptophan synthase subunit alpha [Phycisphaerales bacterium]
MSRIDDIFTRLRANGGTALMPFITAGFPSLEATERSLPALANAGAHIVELGIPFSDPIADGPVIAASMHEALMAGITPAKVFDIVRNTRDHLSIGIIAMVSFSIIRRLGVERFINEAAAAGFDGLIVPDIDLEQAAEASQLAGANDLSFSLLIAPTTPDERIAEVVSLCRGFVYVLARVGITGEQSAPPQQIAHRVRQIRGHTDMPLAVGFGISTAEHVAAVTQSADAAIVGSALVRRMGEAADPVAAAGQFVGELASGLARRDART